MANSRTKKKKPMLALLADENKEVKITFRVSKAEFDEIQKKADQYAGGKLSRWVRFAAKKCEPIE